MSIEKPRDTGGLSPQYQTYERQKCFIAYTEQADWSDDLLSACLEVLSRPEFNLEPDYAGKHFAPDVPLRQKVLELIANARYGIYDLSYWQDEKGEWQMPRNVFIELGMAIALNRPTLLLRHASNRELELPECLQSVNGHILEFSGETTLKRALEKRLPQWVNAPPERDWWNRFCIFGGRTCEYREVHPRARQWGQKSLRCHISDGPDIDRDDFRGVVEEVLERFSDVTYTYLDALSMTKGCDFLLCAHCQTVRSTPFAIYRITPHTPAETFIAIGMSIALEAQFEYKIPKMLLTERVQDVPSLLSGYEVVVARSDKDTKTHLYTFIPMVIQKVRQTLWKPRPLPFVEFSLPDEAPPMEPSPRASPEMSERMYIQMASRYGVGYDKLEVDCVIEADGSATVDRKVEVEAFSEIARLDTFLLIPKQLPSAGKGDIGIDFLGVRSLTPGWHMSVMHRAEQSRQLSAVVIEVSPPLSPGQHITYQMTEKLPPKLYAIGLAEEQLDGQEAHYDYFGWSVNRPTRRLSLRVYFPENVKPDAYGGEASYYASTAPGFASERLQHEERIRLERLPLLERERGRYVLRLDVDYPMLGLIYILRWRPEHLLSLAARRISE